MSASRLIAPLPEELQNKIQKRKHWFFEQPKQAFYWLLNHLRQHPFDPTLNLFMASTTQVLGERKLARGYLSQALYFSDHPQKMRHNYLELLIQEGRIEQALSTGLRWLRYHPHEANMHMIVGYAIEKKWGHQDALPYYQRAFKIGEKANFSHFLYMRAFYRVQGAQKALPFVEDHFNAYIKDEEPRSWVLCAEILAQANSAEPHHKLETQMIKAYRQALHCDSEYKEAHFRLAEYFETRDPDLAYTHALRARDPRVNPELYLLLCRLEFQRGDLERAQHALYLYRRLLGSRELPNPEGVRLQKLLGLSS